jgi:membrane protein YdbS with pleckstrin-like domain
MPVISCPDCGRDVSTLAPACPHCGRPSPAAAAPLAVAAPAGGTAFAEETLWRGTPSAVVLLGPLLVIVVAAVAIQLLAHFAASRALDFEASERIIAIGWWATAIVAIILIIRVLMSLLRIRGTLYTITSQRVMIERGLVSKSLSEIDLRYVDDTQFQQGVLDRILGIGNVTLISTDKSTPTYTLRGIPDPRNLRETIRSHAYRVSQRQLFTRAT